MTTHAWWMLAILMAGIVLAMWMRRMRRAQQPNDTAEGKTTTAAAEEKTACDTEACGVDCFCDNEALRRRISQEIVYFEDEELDRFRGVDADAYSDDDIEEFSYVLTTLRKGEVAAWIDSLEKRGVALPAVLKDEAIIMMEG